MSIISDEVQTAITRLEQRKKTEIDNAKQKAMQEKIIPYNADVDSMRGKAIAEITDKANAEIAEIQKEANAKIVEIQQNLATQKTELVERGELNKKEHTSLTLSEVEAEVTLKFNAALENLYKIMESEAE